MKTNKQLFKSNSGGYAALASVLIIGAAVGLIGLTVALTSISEGQISLANLQGTKALNLIRGCSEEALLQINTSNSLPSTIILPGGTCDVITNSHMGDTWDFTVTGNINTYTKKVNLVATRSNTVSIFRWLEVP